MPSIDWNIAECSLSTGIILFEYSLSYLFIIFPAATSVSLFASATLFLVLSASIVGSMPAMPTTDTTAASAAGSAAASFMLSAPPSTLMPVSASLTRSSAALCSSAAHTSSGLNSRACSSSSAVFLFPVIAVTENLSGLSRTMLSVWVPIEPVEPSIVSFILLPLFI